MLDVIREKHESSSLHQSKDENVSLHDDVMEEEQWAYKFPETMSSKVNKICHFGEQSNTIEQKPINEY